MPDVIWEYDVSQIGQPFSVEMPSGAQLLTVQLRHGQAVLWARVAPDAARCRRGLLLMPTGGEPYPAGWPPLGPYVGTIQTHGGSLVWHLFDLGES